MLSSTSILWYILSEERRAVTCPHLVTVFIRGGKQPRGTRWPGASFERTRICSGEVSGRSDKRTLGQSQTAGVAEQGAHILQDHRYAIISLS